MVNDLDIKRLDDIIFKSDKIAVICFFSSNYKPSLETIVELSKIVDEHKDFDLYKVDFIKNKDLVKNFEIITVPTVIFFNNGCEIYRTSGTLNTKQLRNIIKYVKLC